MGVPSAQKAKPPRPDAAAQNLPAQNFAPALTRLLLSDFRSYVSTKLSCDTGPVVLTGDNGVGKTNILEAISLLGVGRGLRSANLRDMARHSAGDTGGGWAVAADMHTIDGLVKIGIGIDARTISDSPMRRLKIDGVAAKGFDRLAKWLPQLWLTPAMDRLFVDSASGRRKFFDRFTQGLVPDHAAQLSAYEKAMRERNKLLQDDNHGTQNKQSAWLDGLEASMAMAGVAIAAGRLQALDRLAAALPHAPKTFPRCEIALEGTLEAGLRQEDALAVEDNFRAKLANARTLDAGAGRTLSGPHRSDFITRHTEKNMPAEKCSTGEQKALLVGLVLAQARILAERTNTVPLLLLDEVAAHLDAQRRAALFEAVTALGGQAWMTGTESRIFADFTKNVTHIQICDGRLHHIDLP